MGTFYIAVYLCTFLANRWTWGACTPKPHPPSFLLIHWGCALNNHVKWTALSKSSYGQCIRLFTNIKAKIKPIITNCFFNFHTTSKPLSTNYVLCCVAVLWHSAPPVVVLAPSGGLWPAVAPLTQTVTPPRGLPQHSAVTCGPAPHGKSRNGVRSEQDYEKVSRISPRRVVHMCIKHGLHFARYLINRTVFSTAMVVT